MYLDLQTDVPGPNTGSYVVLGSYEEHMRSFVEKDPGPQVAA